MQLVIKPRIPEQPAMPQPTMRFSTEMQHAATILQSLFCASFGLVDLASFDLAGIKSFTRFWALPMFSSYSVTVTCSTAMTRPRCSSTPMPGARLHLRPASRCEPLSNTRPRWIRENKQHPGELSADDQ
ncbi:hypothetical protein KR059_012273 [Drosophila kikkawai]|nr:hypothetical protein KR059_012273 [Drosophila kikkawai]